MPPPRSARSSSAYACSTYCEITSTAVPGTRWRTSSAARSPSSRKFGGRRMSTTARSGFRATTSRTSASPSATAATTSMSLSRSDGSCRPATARGLRRSRRAWELCANPRRSSSGLITLRVPSSASTLRRSPRRPLPSGLAPPTPSSSTSRSRRSSVRTIVMSSRLARACLAAFGERLGGHEVGGTLHRRGRTLLEVNGQSDLHRRRVRQRLERRLEPADRKRRGMDTTGEVAGRASRSACCSAPIRASASSSPTRSGPRRLLLGHPRLHAERDKPGLGAVVEIALDPPELAAVLDVHGSGAGRLEGLDPLGRFGLAGRGKHDRSTSAPNTITIPSIGQTGRRCPCPVMTNHNEEQREDPAYPGGVSQGATAAEMPDERRALGDEHQPAVDAQAPGQAGAPPRSARSNRATSAPR